MPLRPLAAAALLSVCLAGRAAEPSLAPAVIETTARATLEPATAERPGCDRRVAPVVPPRSNESMEFQVSYLGMTMGKVRLFAGKVDSSIAPIFMQAQTTSVFAIVTLRQQLASYLDVGSGLPRSGSLAAVEGSYRHTDTVQYDRVKNKATVREVGKYDNTYLIDVPPDATDFIGLVYRLRTLPLEPGARYDFRVLAGRDLNRVVAEVLGREKVETKAGTFTAFKIRVPTGFTGKFSEKNPTFVWLSDDDRRVVVRINADFAIGHTTANLTSYTPGTPSLELTPTAATTPPAAPAKETSAVATP